LSYAELADLVSAQFVIDDHDRGVRAANRGGLVWQDVKLPEGKILIPGLISHQTNVVEHPELVAWRIKNFASVFGKENVIAGTDCGFSQFWDSIRVHPSVHWAKLQAPSDGAALASKELLGGGSPSEYRS
jgi:methionine synthase II (cobalamin-independent)